jgi:hypothetical protein
VLWLCCSRSELPCLLLLQVLLLIGGDVLERCMAMVRQLKGITATYRMTAKGPPVRHSHYVAGEAAAAASGSWITDCVGLRRAVGGGSHADCCMCYVDQQLPSVSLQSG